MTKLTVIEAARAGYAGRATIYRKLNAGLLTTETDDQGTTVIEAAELIRIFGEPRPPRETSRETPFDAAETKRLQAENALLRAENADLRLHRDRLMALLEQTARPGTSPPCRRPHSPPPPRPTPGRSRNRDDRRAHASTRQPSLCPWPRYSRSGTSSGSALTTRPSCRRPPVIILPPCALPTRALETAIRGQFDDG